MEPKIIIGNTVGEHNSDLEKSIERIDKSKAYEDLSTIIICPTRGMFPTRVVQSWMNLMKPVNQKVVGPIFAESMKVDVAYNTMIEYILNNNYLKNFKYILTIEEDNIPPPDGLLKLYENIDKYDVVGGLYWSKGDNGFPMIFGESNTPLIPKPGEVQECKALGMGFNLFKLDMFKKMESPWFKTIQEDTPEGTRTLTQDFYFYHRAVKEGFKIACDNRVLVGHFDYKKDKIW
jgi:hypothetical protein